MGHPNFSSMLSSCRTPRSPPNLPIFQLPPLEQSATFHKRKSTSYPPPPLATPPAHPFTSQFLLPSLQIANPAQAHQFSTRTTPPIDHIQSLRLQHFHSSTPSPTTSFSQDPGTINTHIFSTSAVSSESTCPSVDNAYDLLSLHRAPSSPLRSDLSSNRSPRSSHVIFKARKCPDCHLVFRKADAYRSHIRQMHPRRFLCSQCSSSFTRRCDMEKHEVIVHQGIRPWRCNLCDLAFGQKHHLGRHILAVHKKARPYKCVMCPMKFGRKEHLVNHEKAVHGKGKVYMCALCTTRCLEKDGLVLHIMDHHNVASSRAVALADFQLEGKGSRILKGLFG